MKNTWGEERRAGFRTERDPFSPLFRREKRALLPSFLRVSLSFWTSSHYRTRREGENEKNVFISTLSANFACLKLVNMHWKRGKKTSR